MRWCMRVLWFALSESYCISRRTIAAGTLYGWLLMMLEIPEEGGAFAPQRGGARDDVSATRRACCVCLWMLMIMLVMLLMR